MRHGLAFDVTDEFRNLMVPGGEAELYVLCAERVYYVLMVVFPARTYRDTKGFEEGLFGELALVIHEVADGRIQTQAGRSVERLIDTAKGPVFDPLVEPQWVDLPQAFDGDLVRREFDLLEI